MQKAFIFDIDGVLINSEPFWENAKEKIYLNLLGKEIREKMGSTIGLDMNGIYKKARALGSTVEKKKLFDAFYAAAPHIYQDAPLTPGLEKLEKELSQHDYLIGLVSASPQQWTSLAVSRLPFKKNIKVIVSLTGRPTLAHKPAPDGYIEAMKKLGTTPRHTIILEDSNAGIMSAKSSKAFSIGFKENLIKGYEEKGADTYANTME